MPELDFDPATGIVKGGRFVGRHIDEVMKYLEALEAQEPPPNDPEKKPEEKKPEEKELTPEEKAAAKLAEEAAKRLSPMDQLALQNAATLESNDEAAFAATVPDYEKYRAKIAEVKKNTHITVR